MDFKIAAVVLALFLSMNSASAAVTDVGAAMVQQGINMTLYSIGDSMISLANGSAPSDPSLLPNTIFNVLTLTVDPYAFPWVHDWWNTVLIFYVAVFMIAIIAGGAFVLIEKLFPEAASRINWIIGEKSGMFHFNKWIYTIACGMVFPFLTIFGVYFILQINYIITALITTSLLNVVPPVANNVIAYLFMSVAFLNLSMIMAARNIIITLFAAGSLALAALYLIPQLRGFATSAFMYFLVLVFLQPIIVFTAAIGITFINNLPPVLLPFQLVSYVVLMLLLSLIGIVGILGMSLFKKIIYGGTAAIMVA
jgi:hypothetical protein